MSFASHASVWSNRTQRWRSLPHVAALGRVKADYDPARDRVYVLGQRGAFLELDPGRGYAVTHSESRGWQSEGIARFDPVSRYLYFSTKGVGIRRFKISARGEYGPTEDVLRWDKGSVRSDTNAFAVHTPTGDLVHWNGGEEMFRYDLDTGRIHTLTPSQLPPTPKAAESNLLEVRLSRVRGRFRRISRPL